MLVGLMVFVVAGLPVVAVEEAPGCPEVAALVEDLDLQLDAVGRTGAVAGAHGEYHLRVDARPGDRLHVELVDAGGRVVLAREVPGAGASCEARSRAVAVVVERWLAGLPVPPAGLAGSRAAERASRPWLGVEGGPVVTIGLDPLDSFVGLTLGMSVRPVVWLRVALDGALYLPHGRELSRTQVSILRGLARLRVAAVFDLGPLALEAGPTLRLDLTSVSSRALAGDSSELRASPSVGLAVGPSLRLGTRARVALLVEPWAALDAQTYTVADGGPQEVHRTPAGGVQIELVAGAALF